MLDELEQSRLGAAPVPGVGEEHGDVGRHGQGLPHVFQLVLLVAVEEVDGHHEGHTVALHVVDRREAVGQPVGVDQHDGPDRSPDEVVPHELEAVLPRGAEQVEDQVLSEGDPPEVHGDGGRRLAGVGATGLVDALGHLGHGGFGGERRDLGDRPHEGGLPDGEATCHDDLDGEGRGSGGGDSAGCDVRGTGGHRGPFRAAGGPGGRPYGSGQGQRR